MTTETIDHLQSNVAIYTFTELAPAVKQCTICNTEVVTVQHIHYTSFGLQLCDECLYL